MSACFTPGWHPAARRPRNRVGDVPFNDLLAQHRPLLPFLHRRFDEVVEGNAFVGGQWLTRFEQEWATYCGVSHAVGVANGTDAIELVLRGLGVGRGDEVIVPANTFVATVAAVVAVGASPVFVDVDPGTLLITPASVLSALSPATAAVIAVHLFGQMVDVNSILSVTSPRGIAVVEDAAQAHGATRSGIRAGALGRAGTFSFYPGKNLSALGDGGAVVTNDTALAERVRMLANHGRSSRDGVHVEVGRNSRLDGLQAAFLSVKLAGLDDANERRRAIAARYRSRLADLPVQLLQIDEGGKPVHHIMAVRVHGRDRFRRRLAEDGIATSIHYPVPCHRQPAFERFSRGYLPVVERAAGGLVSLPMFPDIADDDLEKVCQVIHKVLTTRAATR